VVHLKYYFASESSTFIRVKYTSEYSSAGTGFRYANYLLRDWKHLEENGIEKLNLKMNIIQMNLLSE
jgi:hypothetical protein